MIDTHVFCEILMDAGEPSFIATRGHVEIDKFYSKNYLAYVYRRGQWRSVATNKTVWGKLVPFDFIRAEKVFRPTCVICTGRSKNTLFMKKECFFFTKDAVTSQLWYPSWMSVEGKILPTYNDIVPLEGIYVLH